MVLTLLILNPADATTLTASKHFQQHHMKYFHTVVQAEKSTKQYIKTQAVNSHPWYGTKIINSKLVLNANQ